MTVKVKPAPNNLKDKCWLPSRKVSLTEQWSNSKNKVEVGTPITRTLTLSAVGLMALQLPPLTTTNGQDYNSYSGQAKTENQIINAHLVATKTINFVAPQPYFHLGRSMKPFYTS